MARRLIALPNSWKPQQLLKSGWMVALVLSATSFGCGNKKENKPVPIIEKSYGFDDATIAAHLESTYENGEQGKAYSIVESLGGGVGLLDFDLDGRLDVWLPGGGEIDPVAKSLVGYPSKLFRQNATLLQFAEVSDSSRSNLAGNYTHGCCAADYDADGLPDVLVTGYQGLQFFRNLGDGTFTECGSALGLTDNQWSSSAGFGDFNRDGLVDLYIAHYVNWSWDNDPKCQSAPPDKLNDVCTPTRFDGLKDVIYLNVGDGFKASTSGLVEGGKGLGVLVADLDDKNGVDIYVANDTTENFLYINNGSGELVESGLVSGTAVDHRGTPNGSMGLALIDFDGDEKSDLWVTNFENETFGLYRNQSEGNFHSIAESTGVTAIGSVFVGFGTVAVDVELDGDEDLIVSNGHVQQHPVSSTIAQPPLLLINEGHRKLVRKEFSDSSYFAQAHRGRGVVTADLNSDGLSDFLFSHVREPASLVLNRCSPQGTWVALRLIGTSDNRDAIGSRVELVAGGQKMVRQVVGGGSYLSQSSYVLQWGVTASTLNADANITWPNGEVQTLRVEPGQVTTVIQP